MKKPQGVLMENEEQMAQNLLRKENILEQMKVIFSIQRAKRQKNLHICDGEPQEDAPF